MEAIETRVRKWGHSLGLVLPKEIVDQERIKPDQKIKILIIKENDAVRKTFGILRGKLKKSTQQIMDETRKELYDQ